MSAPKDKVKQLKMAKKRKRKEAARLKHLRKRNGESSGGDFLGPAYRFDAPGGVKMSTVLEEFVEPYADEIDGLAQYRRLLLLGQVAWNAALRAEPERREMVEDVLAKGFSDSDPEMFAIARSLVETMIARKERLFYQYRRPILSFHVQDTGDGWHLTVASVIV